MSFKDFLNRVLTAYENHQTGLENLYFSVEGTSEKGTKQLFKNDVKNFVYDIKNLKNILTQYKNLNTIEVKFYTELSTLAQDIYTDNYEQDKDINTTKNNTMSQENNSSLKQMQEEIKKEMEREFTLRQLQTDVKTLTTENEKLKDEVKEKDNLEIELLNTQDELEKVKQALEKKSGAINLASHALQGIVKNNSQLVGNFLGNILSVDEQALGTMLSGLGDSENTTAINQNDTPEQSEIKNIIDQIQDKNILNKIKHSIVQILS